MLASQLYPFINQPLVSVNEVQRDPIRQFKRGFVRVIKDEKSLGYLISDKMMEEILEEFDAHNPGFLKSMTKMMKEENNLTTLEEIKKEFDLN